MSNAGASFALDPHTRRFLWATIGVIVPLATLLVLFPRHTAAYWMWVMRDPRSAVLVGAVYAGATLYYLLALLSDDWLEAQAGLEGIFTVSAVLLVAVVLHWEAVRSWHAMTLVWLPAYYVPLFFVPYLFRMERGWARLPRGGQALIPRAAAVWLTARGFLYAAMAATGFILAGTLSTVWPWAIDPVEVRMFLGQPATFILPGLAILRGNLLWRRHRLPLLYLGALGVIQLAALLALPTPYRWASPLGVLLPLMFTEWFLTPLVLLGRRTAAERAPGDAPAARPALSTRAPAATLGVAVLSTAYLAIGLLGFLPIASVNPTSGGATYLLRHIAVNGWHNVLHVSIGITGLMAVGRMGLTRMWGIAVGAVLLVLFAAGLVQAAMAGFPREHSLLGLVTLNSAGHVFHFATGVVALIFGLASPAADGPMGRASKP
jgi:hypothetical protein